MRPSRNTTEKPSSSVLHTMKTVECRQCTVPLVCRQTSDYNNPNVTVLAHISAYTECRGQRDGAADGSVAGERNTSWHSD